MKIKTVLIILLIFYILPINGKEYSNSEFRFSIELPDNFAIQEIKDTSNSVLCTANGNNVYISIKAYKSNDGVYNVSTLIKQLEDEISYNTRVCYDTWTNILRNSIRISEKKDNIYKERFIIFRSQTLFDLIVYSDSDVSQLCTEIFDTIDIDLTLYSKMKIATSTINDILLLVIGIIYFNSYILLGSIIRKYKNTPNNKYRIIISLLVIFVVLPMFLLLYLLRVDMTFAIIVISTISILGLCLISNNKGFFSFAKSIIE